MSRYTLACPCGLFRQGLDVLTAYALIGAHTVAMLCDDDTYDTLLEDMFTDAQGAVTR